jgi:hypothetical protein
VDKREKGKGVVEASSPWQMMVDSRAAATSGATATPVDICAMLPESWSGKQREEFQCRRPPEQQRVEEMGRGQAE